MSSEAPATLPGSNLRWYLNRLRCMPPAEIPFRLRRALAARLERMQSRSYAAPAPDLSRQGPLWIHATPAVDTRSYVHAAEQIAEGKLDVFNLRSADLGSPPRWNTDPRTGTHAPLSFGKLLDYRDPALVGDIKYLWEPNRHLQLVTLAQAYALTRDARHVQALFAQLKSWFAACPCGIGPNWSSSLEPALRLINWSLAWQLLGGLHSEAFASAEGQAVRDEWLRSVHQHATFIRGFHSFHSSANNHLIGEAAGVFLAGITWPHWRGTETWIRDAQALLVREALLQNAPDGVNREQAVCYQQFELDLLLLPWLAGRAGGTPFPPEYTARLEAMLEYLASIIDAGGNVPMFGDSDDGRAVRLSQEPDFCPYRSLLATGTVLFGRADFRTVAVHLDDKTRWLCGADCGSRYHHATRGGDTLPVRRAFSQGGYYILGCDFESASEVKLVVDAGPLGYGPLAAHGHADALSFTLSLGGVEMLVDPGTYTYRPDTPWRAYFRGTSAHNTVRIDGIDQSEPGGSFMWLSKANAGCTRWFTGGALDGFDGWQDGYMRLADPVMHRRKVLLEKTRRRIIVEDRLEMQGTHLVEIFFHFAEDCRLQAVDGQFHAQRSGREMHIQLPRQDGSEARICHGQESPPLGWISRRFDDRQASPVLVWSATLAGPASLRTVIGI